jgi:hypothetical protein
MTGMEMRTIKLFRGNIPHFVEFSSFDVVCRTRSYFHRYQSRDLKLRPAYVL